MVLIKIPNQFVSMAKKSVVTAALGKSHNARKNV
jgi:hypothetical protein